MFFYVCFQGVKSRTWKKWWTQVFIHFTNFYKRPTNWQQKKERRELFVPKLNLENSLYDNDYEIKLHNEMTLKAM